VSKKLKTKSTGPAYKSPEYMRELGRRRWKKVKKEDRSKHFSAIAKKSHRVNNPEAKRVGYNGGRPEEGK
jgi:hypothetical protein